ncbi:putative serine threonine protein kinase [Rosellinia necatrix]|uniref:Putative serine threonine protein kinase n=1 Tax=Rosellinia necatrix TaxID=77044 RepID=A0A1W2TB37_ROSNE|nr:putative serine threonine protein kinase [Rosellinia necatrix]
MGTPTSMPLSSAPENRGFSGMWKKFTGKDQGGQSPPSPRSEPGLSRDSSVGSGLVQKASRKVVPRLPRAKTFKRQVSEDRKKLEPTLPTSAERRAVSVDRRMQLQSNASRSSQLLPRASAPDFFDDSKVSASKLSAMPQAALTPQGFIDEEHFSSLNNIDPISLVTGDDHINDQQHHYPDTISLTESQSINASQYDALVRDELERKWILNLSMHYRDKSKREKFFVTYRERESIWRRVTISLDYRNAPSDSLEKDLSTTRFQRDKSAKIYEAIRESLQDIQFYDTVTNLKLETDNGRLHVHVVEDVTEIIDFPPIRLVKHMGCRRVRESEIEFDSHMSGFVYKVRVDGCTLIKKEIPGPDTIDEFLYEVNALNSLRFSQSVIGFYGLVVDDGDQFVKGLLISYAKRGALIDVIFDTKEQHLDLPWPVREKWAKQIVQGLSDIHETGFVQGDFTLSNIVIDDFGNAKIIDINRRGCPVGWEPPEAAPLIDNNQRISMYIGVKSDLFQLGMVLCALASLDDEPETRRRPLRLNPKLNVPSWYREIVETCLHDNPRVRLQANVLLTKFPETPYDGVREEGLPSMPIHDDGSFGRYTAHESYGIPEIRTVEPREPWPYTSVSNTQATSPSFSDEPYYPPRGRSPARPLPPHQDLHNSLYGGGNATWAKAHDEAAVDHNPTADEAMIGISGNLQETTYFGMEEELEQIQADLQAGTALENEQPQVPGGDSPVQAFSPKTVVEPHVMTDDQDESGTLSNGDESKVLTPTYDLTPSGSPDRIPTGESAVLETALEIPVATEKITKDGNTDASLVNNQTKLVAAGNHEHQAEPTKTTTPRDLNAHVDNVGPAYTYDRTDGGTEDIPRRPTEVNMTPRQGLSLAETPERAGIGPADEDTRESNPLVYSDKRSGVSATNTVGGAGITV